MKNIIINIIKKLSDNCIYLYLRFIFIYDYFKFNNFNIYYIKSIDDDYSIIVLIIIIDYNSRLFK